MAKKQAKKPAQVRKTVAVEQAKVDKVKKRFNLKSDSEALRYCLDQVVAQIDAAAKQPPPPAPAAAGEEEE